ncbi:hypothetical protein, partial [Nonomuraea sp. NPDC049400]|uniref:hypothetical protein n=1 Tax=Nonomuraea sp. NPDC049400 TaxID=3364352 RepID=UPI0037910DAE
MASHDTAAAPPAAPAEEASKPAQPSGADAVLRAARKVAHHERGKLALLQPVAWLATLHTTAWAADGLEVHPLIRAGVITATAVAVLGNAERRGQDLPIVPVAAGVLWATAASVFGPYGWVAILLWIAGIIMAVPFWVTVLRRPRPRVTPQQPAARKSSTTGSEVELWQKRVVPNHQAFKLTHLEQVEPVPDGYTGIVVGERGPTRFSQMSHQAAIETIASANGVHIS